VTSCAEVSSRFNLSLFQSLPAPRAFKCLLGFVHRVHSALPPPGSHIIMLVAGSLAGIDEALKRYASSFF